MVLSVGIEPQVQIYKEQSDYINLGSRPTGEAFLLMRVGSERLFDVDEKFLILNPPKRHTVHVMKDSVLISIYMQTLIYSETVPWLPKGNLVETYTADSIPSIPDSTSAYSFVFKNGKLLMTELRESERPTRRIDIPGGHVDEGESLEDTVIRETFEETGVIVKVKNLIGYKKIILNGPKPVDHPYPHPISYMAYYFCEIVEETKFEGNDETHGRVWLDPIDFEKSEWCIKNKKFLEEVIKNIA